MLLRQFTRCMLEPDDVAPSHEGLSVVGAFNPGVTELGGEVVLLVRIAETPAEARPGHVGLPRWTENGAVVVDWELADDWELVDRRVVRHRASGRLRLTFTSHLRVFTSTDWRTLGGELEQRIFPEREEELYGIEDPRITRIGDTYYITYVAVSVYGAATALLSTKDFRSFTRHGIILPPENKDVLLFPERINGDFVALHRPNPNMHFSPPGIWLASSPDLVHWGQHRPLLAGTGQWESGKIGGGCPPLRVADGWLEIYHGNAVTPDFPGVGIYTAGAILLDAEHPSTMLRRSEMPLMVPETDFEKGGYLNDVIFPTAILPRDDLFYVYYGAADCRVGVTAWKQKDVFDALRAV